MVNSPSLFPFAATACSIFQFTCNSGDCIPLFERCDNTEQCPDGSDEIECDCDPNTQFECQDGSCIPRDWTCDDLIDCSDGIDENPSLCTQPTPPPSPTTIKPSGNATFIFAGFILTKGMFFNLQTKCTLLRVPEKVGPDKIECPPTNSVLKKVVIFI